MLRILGFQITCLEIKESLGGMERWDPALTAGDTWVLGVAQGIGKGDPAPESAEPSPPGWAVGTPSGCLCPTAWSLEFV